MRSLGKAGEDAAVSYLKRKGYRILERNYRTVFGEVDIIAMDGGVFVFTEVKTRSDGSFGLPFEAVGARKRERMRKVALSYLKRMKKEVPARFDVVSISVEVGRESITHIKDAFDV